MNITPIESILHHRPNCNCDTCARNVKPFRAGRFVDKAELDQMQQHIQELIRENERLSALVAQFKKADEEHQQQQHQERQLQLLEQARAAQAERERQLRADESDDEDDEPVKPTSRGKRQNMTIVIDNTKLMYLALLAVVVLIVLKK
jgi:TolA-binding protein